MDVYNIITALIKCPFLRPPKGVPTQFSISFSCQEKKPNPDNKIQQFFTNMFLPPVKHRRQLGSELSLQAAHAIHIFLQIWSLKTYSLHKESGKAARRKFRSEYPGLLSVKIIGEKKKKLTMETRERICPPRLCHARAQGITYLQLNR